MPKKVEFIESYIKVVGSDYQWCDNHGELIRCRDCSIRYTACPMVVRTNGMISFFTEDDDYCSKGKRKEAEDG